MRARRCGSGRPPAPASGAKAARWPAPACRCAVRALQNSARNHCPHLASKRGTRLARQDRHILFAVSVIEVRARAGDTHAAQRASRSAVPYFRTIRDRGPATELGGRLPTARSRPQRTRHASHRSQPRESCIAARCCAPGARADLRRPAPIPASPPEGPRRCPGPEAGRPSRVSLRENCRAPSVDLQSERPPPPTHQHMWATRILGAALSSRRSTRTSACLPTGHCCARQLPPLPRGDYRERCVGTRSARRAESCSAAIQNQVPLRGPQPRVVQSRALAVRGCRSGLPCACCCARLASAIPGSSLTAGSFQRDDRCATSPDGPVSRRVAPGPVDKA